jgi:hypothetical protein
MITERYIDQLPCWPKTGQHILAQYDEETILVYQAYRPAIGHFAVENQFFGGEFSFSRMSWIKTNFLWMMYRSGWGTKPSQDVTLAIRLRRTFFDHVLEIAVPSGYDSKMHDSKEDWKSKAANSNVRLQWDPDHDPTGTKEDRRAVQLGLRGSVLAEYGRDAIVEILDLSEFVAKQRLAAIGEFEHLIIPRERIYLPASPEAARNVQLSAAVI